MPVSPCEGSEGVLQIEVLVDGAMLAADIAIASIEIRKQINSIPTAMVTLIDGDMEAGTFPVSDAATLVPGSALVVKAGYGGVLAEIFTGIVVRHGVKISDGNEARLVLECRDKALAMTVTRQSANHVDQSDSDVIKKLVGAHAGLSSEVGATDTVHKELVQFECSDWDFALARAEANGLLAIVEAGKVAVQAPEVSAAPELKVTYGMDLMEFDAQLDASYQYDSVESSSWDPATQAVLKQVAPPSVTTGQGNLASKKLAETLGAKPVLQRSAAPLETTELTSWSKARQMKSGLARIRGRVSFQGSAKAKVGGLLELAGVGERFNGNAFIGGVTHRIRDGNWVTEVELGIAAEAFTRQKEISAPTASGLSGAVPGLQVGVVLKLDADPQAQYKIKVSVPVMQAATDGVWARMASMHGSNGFGTFFVPEIGDEVVLGYFNDDPSHPVVLGSLYSSKRKAPYELTAENNLKAVVTRAKMRLTFDEEKKVVTLETPGKNKIVISDDGKSILLQDQTNNKVELSESGILLDSPKDIKITAKGKITLDAVGNVEITAKADIKSSGLNINETAQVGFVAKGAASAELSASGTTTIKGAMVMVN